MLLAPTSNIVSIVPLSGWCQNLRPHRTKLVKRFMREEASWPVKTNMRLEAPLMVMLASAKFFAARLRLGY
jgi:hypothetical protein